MNNLSDFNLLSFGNTIQLSGMLMSGENKHFLCFFPEDFDQNAEIVPVQLSKEEWDRLIRQTDLLETEVLQRASDGKLAKIIVRKSTRQVEQGISWRVFKRDGYACRYCGKDDLPLTVDHVVLWEALGPTTEDNLVAACKKCNKTRGNTPYEEWLKHPFYLKVSAALSPKTKEANESLLSKLPEIERRINQRSR